MLRYGKALLAFPILLAVLASGSPAFARSEFGVNLNINLGPPPVLVAPPEDLVLIPGTAVYFIPGVSADIFFFDGYWWAPRGPGWYRAYSPNGPWVIVDARVVPGPLFRIPRDYRVVYRHERHIPYGRWEREHGRHWDGREHGEHRGGREHGEHGGGERHGRRGD